MFNSLPSEHSNKVAKDNVQPFFTIYRVLVAQKVQCNL